MSIQMSDLLMREKPTIKKKKLPFPKIQILDCTNCVTLVIIYQGCIWMAGKGEWPRVTPPYPCLVTQKLPQVRIKIQKITPLNTNTFFEYPIEAWGIQGWPQA